MEDFVDQNDLYKPDINFASNTYHKGSSWLCSKVSQYAVLKAHKP